MIGNALLSMAIGWIHLKFDFHFLILSALNLSYGLMANG